MLRKIFICITLATIINAPFAISQNNRKNANSNIDRLAQIRLPDTLSFCGEQVPLDYPEVKERAEREFYLNLQQDGQLILYIKRAGRFFPLFEKILKDENMPEDLKYVAIAESALYQARSNKDAVGIWQFIESTGRNMGLTINESVDERRNPEKSCKAAAKYLRQGHEKMKNWTLAVAGYNMGYTNLESALEYQKVKSYYDLYLNEETSRYIFRIIAIKEILTHPDKYGFNLNEADIYSPEETDTVVVNKSIPNLGEWCREQKILFKDVKLLNPWILKKELPSPRSEGWSILIPKKKIKEENPLISSPQVESDKEEKTN